MVGNSISEPMDSYVLSLWTSLLAGSLLKSLYMLCHVIPATVQVGKIVIWHYLKMMVLNEQCDMYSLNNVICTV